jgi:uroporphyrinogen-III synthase
MTGNNARPVVITRPLAQALPLAQRVTALGREAIVFPLLDIQPIPDPAPLKAALADPGRYAMIAFVSPNAIDAAFAHRAHWPAGTTFAVVGEGSRRALARHGITAANARIVAPTDPKQTDSQTLLQVLHLDALRGSRVLIVRGETGRELLADALRGAGVEVERVAAYRRAAPALDPARRALLARLVAGDADWIVTSSEALRILLDQVRETCADGADAALLKLRQQQLIVPHVRIADTARSLGFTALTLTGSGDESMLAALQSSV